MASQETAEIDKAEIKAKIAELRKSYTKLALECKSLGLKVNPETVQYYLERIQGLEAQLNN